MREISTVTNVWAVLYYSLSLSKQVKDEVKDSSHALSCTVSDPRDILIYTKKNKIIITVQHSPRTNSVASSDMIQLYRIKSRAWRGCVTGRVCVCEYIYFFGVCVLPSPPPIAINICTLKRRTQRQKEILSHTDIPALT